MATSTRLGYIFSMVAAIVWAGTGPGIKYLLDTHNASGLAIALWRDIFVTVALGGVLVLFNRQVLKIPRHDLIPLIILGIFTIGIYHALWIWSVGLNGASIAVVLIYLFPTFVTIGARFFYNEAWRLPQIISLLLSFIGLVLLVRLYDLAYTQLNWLGITVGLSTAILQAGYVLYSQKAVRNVNPWATLTVTMASGSIALLVMFALAPLIIGATNAPNIVQIGDMTAWLVLLFLAVGPTLGGYGLFNLALRRIPASVGGIILVLEAPVASAIAILFLGEILTTTQFIGMGLILLAIVLPTVWKGRA